MIVLQIATLLLLLFVGLVLLRSRVLSFRGQSIEEYDGLAPIVDLRRHLNGPMICDGVIFGPTGRVASRFTARMHGDWRGNTGTLTIDFSYDSGAEQHRRWTFTLGTDGTFVATAPDILGQGRGRYAGPAIMMTYVISLPADAGGHHLSAVDWMYLTEGGTLVNRSQFRKFGIVVAELVATIRPDDVTTDGRGA